MNILNEILKNVLSWHRSYHFILFFLADLRSIAGNPYTFSLTEIQNATEYFANDNKIGEGGFGTVYKVH